MPAAENPDSVPASSGPAGSRLAVFRLLALLAAILIGLSAAETVLRWRQEQVRQSDRLDPGLVRYDAEVGWSLTPGWSGRHRHHDFEARYSISLAGHRDDSLLAPRKDASRLTMLVGDSFAFGLGVNDDQTFAHYLNVQASGRDVYVNWGVPGFSTDQEALLIERRLLREKPDRIVLLVYVANDVFDNERPVPLQVGGYKPYFEATRHGDLVLHEVPGQPTGRPAPSGSNGLMEAVLGADRAQWNWRQRMEMDSELFRLFSQTVLPAPRLRDDFAARFEPACRLTDLLIARIAAACVRERVGFTVALLAGRSWFERPGSVSAQYQDYLLDRVAAGCARNGVAVIDLPRLMREHAPDAKGWFFAYDGHLTVAGHRTVAQALSTALQGGRGIAAGGGG